MSVHYLDCNSITAQIQNADAIDHALEYVLAHYSHAVRLQPSVMVFDNIQALTPSISTDGGE